MDLYNSCKEQLNNGNNFIPRGLKEQSNTRMGTSCSLTDDLEINEADLYLPGSVVNFMPIFLLCYYIFNDYFSFLKLNQHL